MNKREERDQIRARIEDVVARSVEEVGEARMSDPLTAKNLRAMAADTASKIKDRLAGQLPLDIAWNALVYAQDPRDKTSVKVSLPISLEICMRQLMPQHQRYEHDREGKGGYTFLAHYQDHDMYIFEEGDDKILLARYSNESIGYISDPAANVIFDSLGGESPSPLAVAKKFAEEAGLLK